MGASFLLAFIQALLNLRWSYEVYPSEIIAGLTACFLGMGFPLSRVLRSIPRWHRLAILSLPSFSLGGMVFGANLGFLPQTMGLAIGSSLIFMIGPLLKWIARNDLTRLTISKMALPAIVLMVGAILAYSELAPFLVVAIIGSALIIALRLHTWRNILVFLGVAGLLLLAMLNTELLRVYVALRAQSGAIVGTPVDWPLFGFLAHAIGIHGGAWDGFQWSTSGSENIVVLSVGIILFGLVFGLLLSGYRIIWHYVGCGNLMPTLLVLISFSFGIGYFRFFVPAPFATGLGQSWSQFKLSDWAHPFLMVLVLLSLANLQKKSTRLFVHLTICLFLVGLLSSAFVSAARIRPLMSYYKNVKDLNEFYLDFRQAVLTVCPSYLPIYLSLNVEHQKFRQIASMYLYDRELVSNWIDDPYIYPSLSNQYGKQELVAESCLIEPNSPIGRLSLGVELGPFRIGRLDGGGLVHIVSVDGVYPRESDEKNWWHWVEHKARFKLQPEFVSDGVVQIRLHFEYASHGAEQLKIGLIKKDGSSSEIHLPLNRNGIREVFESSIEISPNDLEEFYIEASGHPTQLGLNDLRKATFMVRNVTITPVNKK